MSTNPVASVIIPTYNRYASLVATLNTLANQNCGFDRFEAVIVDDGATDETPQIVQAEYEFEFQYHRQNNQGSAVARNTGAENARGDLLIFVDDDMRLEPDYVGTLIAMHQRYVHVIGMGTELPGRLDDPTRFTRVVSAENTVHPENTPGGQWVHFTHCVTNNISVWRDDFNAIGRMQDLAGDGPTWWGDVDFGYRAERQGFRFYRSHDAICYHCDYSIRDLSTAAQRAEKTAEMVHFLVARYPDILDHLPMFEDKQPIHWTSDGSRLALRKLARRAASTEVGLSGLETVTRVLERLSPSDALLRPLYRWVLGGYIYRGYQRGIANYGGLNRTH